MTEIKVLSDISTKPDLNTLSQEERHIVFEQLAASNKDVPSIYFDSFADMQDMDVANSIIFDRPELHELLLRKIIQLSMVNGINTYVIPIIFSPALNAANIHGGAAPAKYTKASPVLIPQAIRIKFDIPIFTLTDKGFEYIASPNEELDVIGIVFNQICGKLHKGGKGIRGLKTPIDDPVVKNLISIGSYDHRTVTKTCNRYIHGIKHASELPNLILFRDYSDLHIYNIIDNIFTYFLLQNVYMTNYGAAEYVYAQVKAAIAGHPLNGKIKSITDFAYRSGRFKDAAPKTQASDAQMVLEQLHYGKLAPSQLGLLADVYGRGFAGIWYGIMTNGKDSTLVTDQISKYKLLQSQNKFYFDLQKKRQLETNKINSYKIIIENKLGAVRIGEMEYRIKLKPSLLSDAAKILSLLTKNERKIVELEYTKQQQYLMAVLNNKCPHVKLYRQLRRTVFDDQRRKLYHSLEKFFDKHSFTKTGFTKASFGKKTMVKCNNCKFDVICPHLQELTSMELRDASMKEVQSKMNKYIDKVALGGNYYCSICGEVIITLGVLGESEINPDISIDDELKSFIWGEIMSLMKFIKFKVVLNVNNFINSIRDACYPYMYDIEKHILKSKTHSAEDIKSRKRLFATIYALAYIVRLISSNEKYITFKDFRPTSKNILADLIRHAIEIILNTRNVIIREMPGINNEIIKTKLIDAYKSMQSGEINLQNDTDNILSVLLLDDVFKYVHNINNINRCLHNIRMGTPAAHVDHDMGKSVSDMEKATDVFDSVNVPKFGSKWGVGPFDNIGEFNAKNTLNVNLIDTLYPGYTARSFELFIYKLKNHLYLEPLFVDVNANVADNSINAVLREPHMVMQEKYAELRNKEIQFLKYRDLLAVKNYSRPPQTGSRQWSRQVVSLGRVFDQNGNPHKWDVFITNKGQEMQLWEINKLLLSGIKFTDTITDKKCSICGTLFSKSDTLDEVKIRNSLALKHIIENFYIYYENRCPLGGIHEFAGDGKCKKCGVNTAMIFGKNNEYFQKFKDKYAMERDQPQQKQPEPPPVKVVTIDAEGLKKWSFNFNIILDLANKLKINNKLISALGAVEKQEYTNVISGVYIPLDAEERDNTRIYVVDSYVKNLITEYNMVRFFHKMTKPPHDLTALVDKSGINRYQLADLEKKLPEIYGNYNDKFAYVHLHKKPSDTVLFCIQSFCEMCLTIWNKGSADTEKLRHDIVDHVVKKILRGEELMTKPGQFSWSLLYESNAKSAETLDANYAVNNGKDDSEESTNLPFSTQDFDMEGDMGEDSDNDLNIGDEYGL